MIEARFTNRMLYLALLTDKLLMFEGTTEPTTSTSPLKSILFPGSQEDDYAFNVYLKRDIIHKFSYLSGDVGKCSVNVSIL